MAVGVSYCKPPMKALAFVGLVLLASTTSAVAASSVEITASTEDKFMHEDHLKLPTEPSYKTIQSPHGDLIDCVPTHLQPAFDHPKLRGQKPLYSVALESPKGLPGTPKQKPLGLQFESWLPPGESCPDGTIPIRRTTEKDLLLDDYVRRLKREMASGGRGHSLHANVNPGHEYAVGMASGNQYYGASAVIDLWAPKVSDSPGFSLSQIWVAAGSYATGDLNTIEAGWRVYPSVYGDNIPRLFIYWTADTYKSTGCYNLRCPGFVQTNKDVVLGGAEHASLVAEIRRAGRGLLAGVAVHHAGQLQHRRVIRRRDLHSTATGVAAHDDGDGERALLQRRARQGRLLPEPAHHQREQRFDRATDAESRRDQGRVLRLRGKRRRH